MTNLISTVSSIEPSLAALTLNEIPDALKEERIRSMDAQQIEDIAYHLVAQVAHRLKIGVEAIKTLSVLDVGDIAVHSGYDPKSSLFNWLIEPVKKILEDSFSLPSSFLSQGVIIPLFNENQTGLLDQIQNESGRVEKQDLMAKSAFSRCTKMHLHLKLDPVYTDLYKELFFSVEEFLDNQRMSYSRNCLSDFHALRCHSFVDRPAFEKLPACEHFPIRN